MKRAAYIIYMLLFLFHTQIIVLLCSFFKRIYLSLYHAKVNTAKSMDIRAFMIEKKNKYGRRFKL